jgi:hypothetical protein
MLYCIGMAIVEHGFGIPRWAKRIKVEQSGDVLKVWGEGRRFRQVATATLQPEEDLFRIYRESIKSTAEKRTGKHSPHIQFANCRDDKELVRFVERFGPILGTFIKTHEEHGWIVVSQPLDSLRREWTIFAGAARLVSDLRSSGAKSEATLAKGLAEIAEGVEMAGMKTEIRTSEGFEERPWYGQSLVFDLVARIAREQQWSDSLPISEHIRHLRGNDVRRYALIALCNLLNAFSPRLVPVRNEILEYPPYENSGILPALYFMLRQDYLRRQEIKICGRADCGAFFIVERSGQQFCGAGCSQKQRQRDYWQETGSALRRKRIARQRRTGKGR